MFACLSLFLSPIILLAPRITTGTNTSSNNSSSNNNNSSSSGSGSLAGTSFESTFFPLYSWLHVVPGSWIAHVVPLLPLLQQQTPPSQKKGFLWDRGDLPRF